jgi:hypothetical protein
MSSGGVFPLPLGINPQGTNYLRALRPLRALRAMMISPNSSGQLERGSQPNLIPCGELTTCLATTLHFFVHDVLLSFTHTARLSCLTGIKRLNARHPILHRWRSLGPFQFAGRYSRLVGFRRVIWFGCHYSPTAFKSGLPSGFP